MENVMKNILDNSILDTKVMSDHYRTAGCRDEPGGKPELQQLRGRADSHEDDKGEDVGPWREGGRGGAHCTERETEGEEDEGDGKDPEKVPKAREDSPSAPLPTRPPGPVRTPFLAP